MLRMAVAVRSTRLKTRSGSAVVTGNVASVVKLSALFQFCRLPGEKQAVAVRI